MKKVFFVSLLLTAFLHTPPVAHAQSMYDSPFDRINYIESSTEGVSDPTAAAKLTHPSDPDFKFTMFIDTNSTASRRFFSDIFPLLQQKYGDRVQYRFITYNLNFFDKKRAMDGLVLTECLTQQDALWENLPAIGAQPETASILPAPYLQLKSREEFDRCVTTFPTATKNSLYARSLESGVIHSFQGVPTFVIKNLRKPQQLDVVVTGYGPFEMYETAFSLLETELTVAETKELKDNLTQTADNLTACQAELATLRSLTFWQRLKAVIGIYP